MIYVSFGLRVTTNSLDQPIASILQLELEKQWGK